MRRSEEHDAQASTRPPSGPGRSVFGSLTREAYCPPDHRAALAARASPRAVRSGLRPTHQVMARGGLRREYRAHGRARRTERAAPARRSQGEPCPGRQGRGEHLRIRIPHSTPRRPDTSPPRTRAPLKGLSTCSRSAGRLSRTAGATPSLAEARQEIKAVVQEDARNTHRPVARPGKRYRAR
jgi:hypothetical protein